MSNTMQYQNKMNVTVLSNCVWKEEKRRSTFVRKNIIEPLEVYVIETKKASNPFMKKV